VAETALDTSAYNKKAKTAMPSGQKTGTCCLTEFIEYMLSLWVKHVNATV
jgi:hypothetical protein